MFSAIYCSIFKVGLIQVQVVFCALHCCGIQITLYKREIQKAASVS